MVRAEQQRAAAVIQRHYGAKGGGGGKGGADAHRKGRRSTVGGYTPHGTPARGAGAPRDRAGAVRPAAVERGSANGRSAGSRKRSTAPTAGMMPPTLPPLVAGRTPRSSAAPSVATSNSGDAPAAAAPAAAAAPRKLFDGETRPAESTSGESEAASALIQGAAAPTLGPSSSDLDAVQK